MIHDIELLNIDDIHNYLIRRAVATYMVRVTGKSMIGAGIYPGSILIVDKSIEAKHSDVIVAALDGDFTVKRLYNQDNNIWLFPENKNFQPIHITPEVDFEIWGVVTSTFRYMIKRGI